MDNEQSENSIDQSIIDTVKNNNPRTVNELVKLVQQENPVSRKHILERIMDLRNQGKISLEPCGNPTPSVLADYIFSTEANWYWIIIIISTATAALVFTIPENAYPIVYARHVLGTIFVLFLPGYSFIRALFPQKEIDNIERATLSIGISLALVPLTGLILNYTPWGIRTTPVTLGLLALTTIFATVAIIREYQTKTKPTTHSESTL